MTTIASTAGRAVAAAGRSAALDRFLAAAPLLASYLVLVVVYAWHGLSHGSPWLFSDELEYTQISRAIAETGQPAQRGEEAGFLSLYTYLLAPVWWISDTQTAYDAAKYLGALVMASALFPTYGLARLATTRWPATFAAIGAAVIPALAYSRLLLTEALAYPVAALAFFLMAKALVTRSRGWIAGALLAVLAATAVRDQLEVLWAVFAGAAAVAVWFGAPARRLRARWGPVEWLAAAAVVAVAVLAGHRVADRTSELYHIAATLPDRVLDFSVWAWGAFAIGLGLLPALAALLFLWRPRDTGDRGYVALAGLLGSSIVFFGLYTAVKTVYLSTVFANVVAERNLLYLAPLVFAATAVVLRRPAANLLALAGAGALLVYLVEETPYQLDHYPYFDAPGLSVLAVLNRDPVGLSDAQIETALFWTTIGLAALLGAAGLVRRARRPLAPALAGLAVVVVAWNLTGLVSFGNGINDLGNRLLGAVPEPPNWIDNVTGGRPTLYLGQAVADPNPVYLTEFWNRSIEAVGTLDDAAIEPGPTLQVVPYARDGRVINDPGVDYVVTNTPGVDPFGELAYRTGDWRLYRVERPLRLRTSITGVYPDGWSGPRAVYNHFAEPGTTGTVDVLVSRVAWTGEDKPGDVRVRVGSLVTKAYDTIQNPCRSGTCVDRSPIIGRSTGERRWVVHAGQERVFRLRVTTPFRVEVTVDPTFSPAEFGGTDLRQFGARVAFVFRPEGS